MKKIQKSVNYNKVIKDLRAIISQGAANIERVYMNQVIKTNWEVGHYLYRELPLDDKPSANNARIIGRLVQAFDRPDGYFYRLIKFAKLYPKYPRESSLSWSHYEVLLTIDDARARQKYNDLAIQKNISSKILYGMIRNDKLQITLERKPDAPLAYTRGRLYHYHVRSTERTAANTATATLDIGFEIYRDIPLNKRSSLHAGHMVRTVRSETSQEIFYARISKPDTERLYTYKAQVERVIDGDTLIAIIDIGLKTKTRQKLRLRGIDCPERTTKQGLYIKEYVKKLLGKQKFIIVKTYKDDKYGRMLADVFYMTKEKDPQVVVKEGIYLNQQLLDEGLASKWNK